MPIEKLREIVYNYNCGLQNRKRCGMQYENNIQEYEQWQYWQKTSETLL